MTSEQLAVDRKLAFGSRLNQMVKDYHNGILPSAMERIDNLRESQPAMETLSSKGITLLRLTAEQKMINCLRDAQPAMEALAARGITRYKLTSLAEYGTEGIARAVANIQGRDGLRFSIQRFNVYVHWDNPVSECANRDSSTSWWDWF